MKKTEKFRKLLSSPNVEFLLDAHNALSAKVVEEAGFAGIWGGGLGISAANGLRDNNELSWTQILDAVEFMNDVTTIPILLDADSGYGNFNNVRRLIRKLEQRGVAAICIEDKLFPKTNSFINGERQPLADIDEFCGKIKAAKDSQSDPDFSVVARIEAFIAGWGLTEALKRAEAYHRAGADAILIHSKTSSADQVTSFLKEWKNESPVIIVPTMYYDTPLSVFEELGVNIVVWANHMMRSSVASMQKAAAQIFHDRSVAKTEKEIIPVKEIFRLQDTDELQRAEMRYLPAKECPKAFVLNMSGTLVLPNFTDTAREAFQFKIIEALNKIQIKDIRFMGYQGLIAGHLAGSDVVTFGKDELPENIFRLLAKHITGPALVIPNDAAFKASLLETMEGSIGDIVIAVQPNTASQSDYRNAVAIKCSKGFKSDFIDEPVYLSALQADEKDGDWIGLMKVTSNGARALKRVLLEKSTDFQWQSKDILESLILEGIPVSVVYVNGQWTPLDGLNHIEIDDSSAKEFITQTSEMAL